MKKNMKAVQKDFSKPNLKRKLKLALPMLIFMGIYLIWFHHLEEVDLSKCHLIHSSLDTVIPFHEIWVIPYFLWFGFIPAVVIYNLFRDEEEYRHLEIILISGMLTFLVINSFFPTALDLRPHVFVRDNFCTRLVQWLYHSDTPTNVFPSIHVYNTVAACTSVYRSHGKLAHNHHVRLFSVILSVLIVLSTMFLKQHSIVDVVFGFLMFTAYDLLEPYIARAFAERNAMRMELSRH